MSVAGKPPAIAADRFLVAILRVRSKLARRLFCRAPYRALIGRAGNPHRIARRDRFLRAVDKPVRKGHSGRDLDIIAEIAAKLNFAQHDLVFPINLATCFLADPKIKAVAGTRSTFGSDGM